MLSETSDVKTVLLNLPYKGVKGETLVKRMKKDIDKCNSHNTKVNVIYKSAKLQSQFNIKDKTSVYHQNDLIYRFTFSEKDCNDTYIGETGRRLDDRIIEHAGKDCKSRFYTLNCKESSTSNI